jgi:hypothetical protein
MRTLLIRSPVAPSACAPDYVPGPYDLTSAGPRR